MFILFSVSILLDNKVEAKVEENFAIMSASTVDALIKKPGKALINLLLSV